MKRLALLVAVTVAVTVAVFVAPAVARPGTIPELKVHTPVGAFGAVPVGSCNLTTLAGCERKTFVFENVGSTTIAIGGFGIAQLDPATAAVIPGLPGQGCEFLPIVAGFWTLAPGSSCEITVTLAPVQKGLTRNELHVWWNNPADPIAVVPLMAVGT